MSQEAITALKVLAPAMGVAIIVLSLAWRPWQRRSAQVQHGYWGGPIALGLGFLAAFFVIAGPRGFLLKDRWHWMAAIVGASVVLGLIAALWRAVPIVRFMATVALAFATGALLQPPATVANPLYWKLAFGAVVLVSAQPLGIIALKHRGIALPLMFIPVFTGLSIMLLETRQAGFSLLAGALAAMCGVAFVIALFNRQFSLGHGGMFVLAAVLPTLSLLGWFYNVIEAPIWPFAILAVSPLMLIVCEVRLLTRVKPWQGLALRLALVSAPVAAAVAWIMMVSQSGADEYSY